MIQIKLTIDSLTLLRPIDVRIALPYSLLLKSAPYKHVWLLHPMAYSGDFFFEQLNIAQLADKYNCALIAPSLGNDFFLNQDKTLQTLFLKEELFPHIVRLFPLSVAAKDTFLLGISMGALAGLEWALQTPFFHSAALLSGVYDYTLAPHPLLRKKRDQLAIQMVFDTKILPTVLQVRPDFKKEVSSQSLFESAIYTDTRFHFYCGEEDYLAIESTHSCFEKAKQIPLDCSLTIESGAHNVLYWNNVIQNAIKEFMLTA